MRLVRSSLTVHFVQRTRIAALACLGILPDTIRYDVLHTVKNKVLKELAKAIDDPKRTVRREAVACRSKWSVVVGSSYACIDTDPISFIGSHSEEQVHEKGHCTS